MTFLNKWLLVLTEMFIICSLPNLFYLNVDYNIKEFNTKDLACYVLYSFI